MSLARQIGLPTATSFIKDFAGEFGYVVKRFDRETDATMASGLKRIHQEDFCQALCLPDKKYQKESGCDMISDEELEDFVNDYCAHEGKGLYRCLQSALELSKRKFKN